MNKTSSSRVLCLAALLLLAAGASAQNTITVQATPFYRFMTQDGTLGQFLTADYSEGTGSPYNYAYQPFPAQADIVPLMPGYTPQANQGLLPLYRWQLVQSPWIYYYSIDDSADLGSDYAFQGVAGYVLPNDGQYGGTPLHNWSSEQYGYSYTLDGEAPPDASFAYRGVQFFLPAGGAFQFEEVPHQPLCFGSEPLRDECEHSGGVWSNLTCSCRRICCEP